MSNGTRAASISLLSLLAVLVLGTLSVAQSELQISRPVDGATVRETVNILVPISSVPSNGFLSCSIDGRFRAAFSSKSSDGKYYMYRWDTKAREPDTSLTPAERAPRDGKHIITVGVYDVRGENTGKEKTITVYVKNSASADMPAAGLKLRYRNGANNTSRYFFKYTLGIKDIGGATTLAAALGEGVEGAQGVIRRTVEDRFGGDQVLVRQRLVDGTLETYKEGQLSLNRSLTPRSQYQNEDSLGRVTYAMSSTSPGTAVTIDLPNLPKQSVRIGDSWTQKEKVFRNAVTGDALTMKTTSTLDGLEWEGGYPCAKLRTSFSGTGKIPFSDLVIDPVNITGETVTYFAYGYGRVVLSTTTATANATVDSNALKSLTQSLLPSGTPSVGIPMPSSGAVTGPPGMGMPMPGPSTGGSGAVHVRLELKQVIQLLR